MNKDDDFITSTIRSVDAMLEGQRRDDERRLYEEEWDAVSKPAHQWTAEEMEEYNALSDANDKAYWDEWLSSHCQLHNESLHNGQCLVCNAEEADERRIDL